MINYNNNFYNWLFNKTLKNLKLKNDSSILVISDVFPILKNYTNVYNKKIDNLLQKNINEKKYDAIILNYTLNKNLYYNKKIIKKCSNLISDKGFIILSIFDKKNINRHFTLQDKIISDIGEIYYNQEDNYILKNDFGISKINGIEMTKIDNYFNKYKLKRTTKLDITKLSQSEINNSGILIIYQINNF
jgi:hypothetical protein